MHRLLLVWLCCPLAVWAAELKFEVEEYTTPTSAWQVNKFSEDHWNLWSTDQNAAAKWSGGVVLQSPIVKADRATPEEGAPVLHTVITGLPNGPYEVSMNGSRTFGLSFDGVTWKRSNGGVIAEVTITDGRFELWVDDRYVNADQPGSSYYDYLQFDPLKQVAPKPQVTGFAQTRVVERLDRGLVAVTGPDGVYLGWRLLPGDPADVAFNVYRRAGTGQPVKVNPAPIPGPVTWSMPQRPRRAHWSTPCGRWSPGRRARSRARRRARRPTTSA